MPESWNDIKERVWDRAGGRPVCRICGIRSAAQYHHGIIWRMAKKKKWLDVEENGIELCNPCHDVAQNYDTAQLVWDINLKRYGAERMVAFVENLHLKVVPAWLSLKVEELK